MATALPEQAPGVAPQVAELRIICRLLPFLPSDSSVDVFGVLPQAPPLNCSGYHYRDHRGCKKELENGSPSYGTVLVSEFSLNKALSANVCMILGLILRAERFPIRDDGITLPIFLDQDLLNVPLSVNVVP